MRGSSPDRAFAAGDVSIPVCPLCRAESSQPRVLLPNGKSYSECACGVTSAAPMPSEQDVHSIYATGYMDLEIPGHGLHVRYKPEYFETYSTERDLTLRDLELEPTSLAGRMVLDVGCANGLFLDYLRRYRAFGVGIDVSAEMVEVARGRGLDARLTPLAELRGEWELVTLWDVLEHLLDPVAALARIAQLVPTGGELIVQTPCVGVISESFGAEWRNYLYPQHVFLFSRTGLRRYLELAGFRVLHEVRFGSGNTAGTIPDAAKRAADRVAKLSGMGDTIAVRAVRCEPTSGSPIRGSETRRGR